MTTIAGRQQVKDLRPGGEVDGLYACSRKDRLTGRSGSGYLALVKGALEHGLP